MKNIRKFETTAEMNNAVLENVSINYNVETGSVLSMPLKPNFIDYSTMYTTFEALEDGTFSFKRDGNGDDIQYSKDNGSTWTPLASNETINVVSGDKVMWKSTITPGYNNGIGKFSSSNRFNAYGNTMSLLYGDDFNGQTSLKGKPSAFYDLFSISTKVIDASNLILPATTLESNCYQYMFDGCETLTKAPSLPATTLKYRCYYYMFYGCTNLTTAPELTATTLIDYCYYGMFINCTNLKHITMLATHIPSYTCLDYWVMGVSSTGTFVKHPNMDSLPTGESGIPNGWTVVDYDFNAD